MQRIPHHHMRLASSIWIVDLALRAAGGLLVQQASMPAEFHTGAHTAPRAAGKKVQQILYRQFLYALDEALGAAGASPRDRVSPWKLPAVC